VRAVSARSCKPDLVVAIVSVSDGLTRARAFAITRVVNTTEAYADLTTRRGWTVAEWKPWLAGLLRVQLLRNP
jgi:hypothetical protein